MATQHFHPPNNPKIPGVDYPKADFNLGWTLPKAEPGEGFGLTLGRSLGHYWRRREKQACEQSLLWATWPQPCRPLSKAGMSMGWPTRGTGNCSMYLPIAPISGSGLLPGALTSALPGQPCPLQPGKALQLGAAVHCRKSVRTGAEAGPSHPLWGLTASARRRCGPAENITLCPGS